MSYDISNYVFKGVPLDEFTDHLDDNKLIGLPKCEDQQFILLAVDENLINCLNNTLGSLEFKLGEDSFKTEEVAKAIVQETNWGAGNIMVNGEDTGIQGVKELLVRTIFIACGVSAEDLKYNEGSHESCTSHMDLSGMHGWPLVERNGEKLAHGVIEIPMELNFFCDIATEKFKWTFEADPKMDEESYEWKSPEFKFNLKETLEWVQSTDEKKDDLDFDDYAYWREHYCAMVINRAMKIEDHYIEEEDSFISDISVESTRHGGVHDCGGMEPHELYLSVTGDMGTYDEDGWHDPEKETPIAFKKTKEILFGDENYDLNKYTPQFGG